MVDLSEYPLHRAAQQDDEEWCRALLAVIDVETVDARGWTPLHVAAASDNGNVAMTRKLLQNKADPNLYIRGVDPPLYHAIAVGSLETVQLLLDSGASVDIKFNNGWTPMMLAAKEGNHEIGKALQAKGANLVGKGANDLTPLHIAAMNGSRVFYKWLTQAGADTSARDDQQRTAMEVVEGFEVLPQL
ncbi:ankyrin [Macroventuria anomochaeta]|uniref:Ankyrin n=1 Tax=Macroventuria anomochaeta TaxID=301207 RepID=A0ACB6RWA3_9PLEO|nr:ankyrin [Macroventuria anomochaeta]KAF2626059.1 ankyrin [Macroventuria anomochaeta]